MTYTGASPRARAQSLGFCSDAGTDPSTNTVPSPRSQNRHGGDHERAPFLRHTQLQEHIIVKEVSFTDA